MLSIFNPSVLYKKVTCQNQIKVITDDNLQIYKTLQLFNYLQAYLYKFQTHTNTFKSH
jgi:hypothetical protein